MGWESCHGVVERRRTDRQAKTEEEVVVGVSLSKWRSSKRTNARAQELVSSCESYENFHCSYDMAGDTWSIVPLYFRRTEVRESSFAK